MSFLLCTVTRLVLGRYSIKNGYSSSSCLICGSQLLRSPILVGNFHHAQHAWSSSVTSSQACRGRLPWRHRQLVKGAPHASGFRLPARMSLVGKGPQIILKLSGPVQLILLTWLEQVLPGFDWLNVLVTLAQVGEDDSYSCSRLPWCHLALVFSTL